MKQSVAHFIDVLGQPTEDSDSRSITIDRWERHSQGGLSS